MRTSQISNLVRIADVNVETWLGCLLDAHTWLRLPLGRCVCWGLYWGRYPRPSRRGCLVFIVVEVDRIHHAPKRRTGGSCSWARVARSHRLLLRRCWRSFLSQRRRFYSQRSQGIIYSLQSCGLSPKLPSSGTSSSWRSRRSGDIWNSARRCFG